MPVTGTGDLGDSRQQLLQAEYEIKLREGLIYAQPPITYTHPNAILTGSHRFSSVAVPFYFALPASTAAISQTADITPSTITDASFSMTVAEYGDVTQLSEFLELTATPDVTAAVGEIVADQARHTIDRLARSVAVGGQMVAFGGDAVARSGVSPLSTADTITENDFFDAATFLQGAPKIPGVGTGAGQGLVAVLRTAVLADLIESSAMLFMAEYGQHPEMLLNGEVGAHMSGIKLIQSEFAKIFQAAGASGAASTGQLSGVAVNIAGSTVLGIDAALSSVVIGGTYLGLGLAESTANGESLRGETVLVTGATGTTALSILGGAANGGTLYSHSSAADTVTGNYQVYATVFMGANAILKAYTEENGIGPFGQVLEPERIGNLKQFWSLGWKWLGGFGRPAENRIYRLEHAANRFTLGGA